jgi:hypothetical protein
VGIPVRQQHETDSLIYQQALRLWLTEIAFGGAGVVEALAERFVGQPARFFQAFGSALSPGDLELAADGLVRTVELAVSDKFVADRLAEMRKAHGHQEREAARERLAGALAQRGVILGHALAVALSARLLRPGASADTDLLLHDLLKRWDSLEARHGVAIGLREYAYIAAVLQADVGQRLKALKLVGPAEPTSRLVQILASLLWPRGPEIRQRALQSYNPYREVGFADAALARALLFETPPPIVSLTEPDWLETLQAMLSSEGSVRLTAPIGKEAALRAAILDIVATPIEVEALHLFPAIERVEQNRQAHFVTFALQEVSGW